MAMIIEHVFINSDQNWGRKGRWLPLSSISMRSQSVYAFLKVQLDSCWYFEVILRIMKLIATKSIDFFIRIIVLKNQRSKLNFCKLQDTICITGLKSPNPYKNAHWVGLSDVFTLVLSSNKCAKSLTSTFSL